MIRPCIKIRKKRHQLESMGVLMFTVCIWMYSIFPLITSHPFVWFIVLSLLSISYLVLCSCYKEAGCYVYKATLIWSFIMIPLLFSNIDGFNIYTCAVILSYVLGIVFIVFCCNYTSQYDLGITILKMSAAIYIFSIYLQYFSGDLFERLFAERFDASALFFYEASVNNHYYIGMGGSPGVAVVNCTIALAILISFNRQKHWKSFLLKLPYMMVIFMAYLLIGKKSGILAAAFALAVVYMMASGGKAWKKIGFLLICVLVGGYALYLLTQMYSDAYLSRKLLEGFKQLTEGRDFSSGRIDLYRAAWNEFLKHPLFGIGWSQFSSSYGNLAHNIYLQLLCETGIVGFVLFSIPIFYNYIKSCKLIAKLNREDANSKLLDYMTFSLYIQSEFLFISLFENNLYMTMPLYLYFFACGISFTAEREYCHKHWRKQEVLPGI